MLEAGAIGALSTHDLALAELAEIAELGGRNVHMASPNEDDPLGVRLPAEDGSEPDDECAGDCSADGIERVGCRFKSTPLPSPAFDVKSGAIRG